MPMGLGIQLSITGRGGGGGGAFSPDSISGLKLWLKADAGLSQDNAGTTPATADGDPVGRWADQSGAGNHPVQATATKRGTLKLAIQNSLPVVRFDGTDDFLRAPDHASLDCTVMTVFLVLSSSGITNYNQPFSKADGGGWTQGYSFEWEGGNLWFFINSYLNNASSRPMAATEGFGLFVGRFDGSNVGSRKNGSAGTDDPYAGTADNSPVGVSVGASNDGTPSYPWKGDIAEVLVYDSALSAGDITSVEAYLNSKWAIY